MRDYLKEYQQYYLVRMKRYENLPDYPESYQSEKAIYDAIASCNELGEFRERLGNLNHRNAVALTRDQYRIRHRYYMEMEYEVHAKGTENVIEKVKDLQDVHDLITTVTNEENANSLAITADTISPFDEWMMLERAEMYEKADVPSSYKSAYKKYEENAKASIREMFNSKEHEMRKFVPGWKLNFDLVFKSRFRRKLPYPDEIIHERISQVKRITGK